MKRKQRGQGRGMNGARKKQNMKIKQLDVSKVTRGNTDNKQMKGCGTARTLQW